MKVVHYIMATALLLPCPGAQAQAKPEKRRSIYLQINGPEESSARLRSAFAEEVAKNHMFVAEDPKKAGSHVNVTITDEHKVDQALYAELLKATLVPGDKTISFCQRVSDGAGSTVTTSYKLRPDEGLPSCSTVWIEGESGPETPAEMLKKKILEAGFQIAASEKDADFSLRDIRLVKVALQGTAIEAKVRSELKVADGTMTTLSGNFKGYVAVPEPISTEAEGCRNSIRQISDPALSSYGQVVSLDVALIAGHLKK